MVGCTVEFLSGPILLLSIYIFLSIKKLSAVSAGNFFPNFFFFQMNEKYSQTTQQYNG